MSDTLSTSGSNPLPTDPLNPIIIRPAHERPGLELLYAPTLVGNSMLKYVWQHF